MKIGLLTIYHQKRSKAAQKAVASFAKHPVSLQDAIKQVQQIKATSRSTVKKGHNSTG